LKKVGNLDILVTILVGSIENDMIVERVEKKLATYLETVPS